MQFARGVPQAYHQGNEMTALSARMRFWTDIVIECNRRDHTNTFGAGNQRGPFKSARVLGMAMAALHDGHALASPGKLPLLPGLPSPPASSDKDVVAAAACREVLVRRYPLLVRFVDGAWRDWLERHGLQALAGSAADLAGRAIGKAIEAIGVADTTNGAANVYTPTGAPYTHDRPADDPSQGFAGSAWGTCVRLLATHVANFPSPPGRTGPTTVASTPHFVADFDKVKAKGLLERHSGLPGTRTPEEETKGLFWGYDGPQEIGTPPRLYMQLALTVLDDIDVAKPTALDEYAELRIVAAIAVALADAGIDAWHYKYSPVHMMWRPCLGIPGAVAGNGVAEPLWRPLGRPDTNGTGLGLTPDFPAYPSGHATFGAAAFQLLRLMLVQQGVATFTSTGLDNIGLVAASDEFDGRNTDPRTRLPRDPMVRGFPNLWTAITENSVSRVYLGVHWQFDGVTIKGASPDGEFGVPASPSALGRIGGVWLGCQIADQIAAKVGVTAATIGNSKA